MSDSAMNLSQFSLFRVGRTSDDYHYNYLIDNRTRQMNLRTSYENDFLNIKSQREESEAKLIELKEYIATKEKRLSVEQHRHCKAPVVIESLLKELEQAKSNQNVYEQANVKAEQTLVELSSAIRQIDHRIHLLNNQIARYHLQSEEYTRQYFI